MRGSDGGGRVNVSDVGLGGEVSQDPDGEWLRVPG